MKTKKKQKERRNVRLLLSYCCCVARGKPGLFALSEPLLLLCVFADAKGPQIVRLNIGHSNRVAMVSSLFYHRFFFHLPQPALTAQQIATADHDSFVPTTTRTALVRCVRPGEPGEVRPFSTQRVLFSLRAEFFFF